MRSLRALFLALMTLVSLPAFALTPDEMLDDPVLEARARALSAELRCLVCQNQSIDASDAQFARDIRAVLRERLLAGDTDGEALDFLVARYGQFILLKPPFNASTLVLWVAPPLLLIGGAVLAVAVIRRRSLNQGEPEALTPEEKRRLEKALRETGPSA